MKRKSALPLLLIFIAFQSCVDLAMSPSSKLPSKKIEKNETEISAGYTSLPKINDESGYLDNGMEIMTRYAFSKDVYVSGKTWISLDRLSEAYVGGLGISILYFLTEFEDGAYLGISPNYQSLNNALSYEADVLGCDISYWTMGGDFNYSVSFGAKIGGQLQNISGSILGYSLGANLGASYQLFDDLFLAAELSFSYNNISTTNQEFFALAPNLSLEYYGFDNIKSDVKWENKGNFTYMFSLSKFNSYPGDKVELIIPSIEYTYFLTERFSLSAQGLLLYGEENWVEEKHLGVGLGLNLGWEFLRIGDFSLDVKYGGGGLKTKDNFPRGGTSLNYYRLWGAGVKYLLMENIALKLSFNNLHISNGKGNGNPENPSLDATGIKFGVIFY